METNQKKDSLMIKFQSSKIERNKLDRIKAGMAQSLPSTATDMQTGMTSSGNHDNVNTLADPNG